MTIGVAIFRGEVLIGHAQLVGSDPPMGMASGRLEPAAGFDALGELGPNVAREIAVLGGNLSAVMMDGNRLECSVSGMGIVGPDGVPHWEVYCDSIPYPLYEDLFPGAHKAYEEGLRARREERQASRRRFTWPWSRRP